MYTDTPGLGLVWMSFGDVSSGPLFEWQVPYKWSHLPNPDTELLIMLTSSASEEECHGLELEGGGSIEY